MRTLDHDVKTTMSTLDHDVNIEYMTNNYEHFGLYYSYDYKYTRERIKMPLRPQGKPSPCTNDVTKSKLAHNDPHRLVYKVRMHFKTHQIKNLY